MNVDIGTEAAQFSEKKYTNGIFLAVHTDKKIRGEKLQFSKRVVFFCAESVGSDQAIRPSNGECRAGLGCEPQAGCSWLLKSPCPLCPGNIYL